MKRRMIEDIWKYDDDDYDEEEEDEENYGVRRRLRRGVAR